MPRSHLPVAIIIVLAARVPSTDAAPKRNRNRNTPVQVTHVAASEGPVDARTTTVEVTVRKRPGERQAAAGTLAAGTEVVVEAEQGRWLRVRAGRIRGYVTRTTVSAPDVAPSQELAAAAVELPDSAAPPPVAVPEVAGPTSWRTARDRETSTPTASSLLATVMAPSTALRARPDATAEQIASVGQGQRVVVVDARKTPGWIAVRDTAGRAGWIAHRDLGNDPRMAHGALTGDAPSAPTPVVQTRVDAASGTRPPTWSLQLSAGAGVRALATETGARGAEQHAGGSASVARLAVGAQASPLRVLSLGIDAHVDLGRAALQPTDGPGAIHATSGLAAGVRIGVRPRDLVELALRAGMRRETTEPLDGTGTREHLAGTTASVRLDVVPRPSRLSARVQLETLVDGSWQRGDAAMASSPRALWAAMTVGVRIVGGLSAHATMELGRVSTAGAAMSEPASARRIDASQLFQVGLSGAL